MISQYKSTARTVHLTKIYTRGGDKGETSLGDGTRVSKNNLRVEAFGSVDEANAAVGLARLYAKPEIDIFLSRIQNDLFDLGADLCLPGTNNDGKLRITQNQIDRLEQEIDSLNKQLSPITSFVLPGGSYCAAYLHLARTITRRAERQSVALASNETVNPLAVIYLNRLSDHFFVLSRFVNHEASGDVLWIPGAHGQVP